MKTNIIKPKALRENLSNHFKTKNKIVLFCSNFLGDNEEIQEILDIFKLNHDSDEIINILKRNTSNKISRTNRETISDIEDDKLLNKHNPIAPRPRNPFFIERLF